MALRYYFLLFITSFLLPYNSWGQAEANIWYFGGGAGLQFIDNEATAITNGRLSTTEGCATISSPDGELLFYTDGVKVWNREHEIMPNGRELMGDPSATQSGVAVCMPGQKNIYFLFTVDVEAGADGLRYSLIDLRLDEGRGDVTTKNEAILSPVAEKITVATHHNRKDYWVIAHEWGSNAFHAYLLTKDGLNKEPVISRVGTPHEAPSANSIGLMKLSPNGKKLAVAIKGKAMFELLDFNNKTGEITNPIPLKLNEDALAYGVEFSSDGSKLYGSDGRNYTIYQYDLSSNSAASIRASRQVIGVNEGWTGGLQLAPNGKIYVSVHGSEYLGIIHNPNKLGKDCNYDPAGLYLKGRQCRLGLPSFVQTFFEDRENISLISSEGNNTIKIGKVFTKNILFETNKYEIRPQYFKELDDLVEYLGKARDARVEITGHTDSIGLENKNLILSQNRAKAVAEYLIEKGIEANRIKHEGFGESRPVADNGTSEGRRRNRRIEFILQKD